MARVLLQRADDDAALVRHVVENLDIADAIVGFHAQQAVEKSVKAVLSACDIEYGKTHQFNYLIGLLVENGIEVPPTVIEADELSPWAVQFRYETDSEPELDRIATLQLIEGVRLWADGEIHSEGG